MSFLKINVDVILQNRKFMPFVNLNLNIIYKIRNVTKNQNQKFYQENQHHLIRTFYCYVELRI